MSTHVSPPTAPTPPAVDKSTQAGRGLRRVVAVVLALAIALTVGYAAISIYVATQVVHLKHVPIYATPASLGLQYKDVTFPSREDHIQLSGWFIPGVLPNGSLTAQRTIIVVHGNDANRASKTDGLLTLSGAIARNGFAVLAFDVRGNFKGIGAIEPLPYAAWLTVQIPRRTSLHGATRASAASVSERRSIEHYRPAGLYSKMQYVPHGERGYT